MQQAEQIAALARAAEQAAWSAADVEASNATRVMRTDTCRHHLECASPLAETFALAYYEENGELKPESRGGEVA